MKKPLTLGSLLLITTALIAPAAIAQTTPAQSDAAAAQDEPQEETVEVSTPGGDMVEDIVVTGRYIPEPVRATPEVISVLSTADIERTGEGDIAGALQRVTGLSVVGNGFVYVRGLGDRYSLALLNGSPLPSPEPLKRVVPLDIFPSSLVASALVQKSYSANYPGEFGGGVINLTTKAIPDEPFFKMGVGISGDTETTGQLGYTYYGSDTDWSGYDDGARDVPGPLQAAFDSGNLITEGANFTARDMQDITASLTNAPTTVLQRNSQIPANFSTDISGGKSWDFGDDGQLGLIASASFSNSWRTRDAIQQTSSDPNLEGSLSRDFRAVITDNRIVLNGLLGLGAEWGDQKVRWTNVYIHDTIKQGKLSRGFDLLSLDEDTPVIIQNTGWFERQLFDTQFVGEFKFDDLSVDVRGTYANTKRESPYERSFSYAYDSSVDDFVNNLTSPGQSARIAFSDLNEDVYAGGLDLSYKLPTSMPITLSAGYAYTKTERDSVRREFRFVPAGAPLGPVAQERPDYLLSDFNIYTHNIQLTETSGQSGAAAYSADLEVQAGYAQFEAELVPSVRFSAGVRYEDGKQSVTPTDLFGTGAGSPPTRINNDYWLPGATLTWNFAEDMQFRLASSKTIARPQFRELALQVYQDPESDRQYFGNPFLQDSTLINAEARYEWYFDQGQRVTIAGFYKKINDPIEAYGFLAGGDTLQTSFINVPEAQLYGAEIEIQKYVALDNLSDMDFFASRRLVLIGNYTYTDSKIKFSDTDTVIDSFGNVIPAANFFAPGRSRPLTGQSDHLANIQVGMESTDGLSQQTLMLTYASKRVTNRGPIQGLGVQPDIVEKPGIRLDFVMREGVEFLGKEFELKFEARNITGQRYEEYQQAGDNRVDINSYDVGTSLSLGVEMKF
ncbi:TonB-dependent receptor domain-containing protein [Sphingomonas cavernae]|uniref:TonB-dependent receptor n=1 Tax=Sphingomonas cavernae TaxID=2320861 RepID=A0A418WNY7_9SPHN|nr:TonB-dependent receptor [Sphingomonas cavernae]RJF92944.1 TonB-dependent receptor [Sphingomonas cavernae]